MYAPRMSSANHVDDPRKPCTCIVPIRSQTQPDVRICRKPSIMCVGENCTQQVVRYVNAQLSAHYENAIDCTKCHNQSAGRSRYYHALAEFTYSPKEEILFQATFDKPRLGFICNHDAVLWFKIKSATYHLDVLGSVVQNSGKDRVQALHDTELAIRVPFTTRSLDGTVLKHNNGQNPLQVIVLDMTKAHLLELASSTGRDALARYLREYLLFLAEAGNHVFFSLPSSDDEGHHAIDYSTMDEKDHALPKIDVMYGVSVDKINEYLSSAWLNAKDAADAKLAGSNNKDWESYCLAEYRSTRESVPGLDAPFHVRLLPLRLEPLCAREAIVYFTVDEILFYEDADFTKDPLRKYTGRQWRIAGLVDVVQHFEHDSVIKLTLDLASARPLAAHCTHGGSVPEEDQLAKNFWARIVDFFTSTYLQILKSVNLDVVYSSDSRGPDLSLSRDRICFDSDRVIVVSESSINAKFKSLWDNGKAQGHRDHEVVEWRYEEVFDAHFRPMTVRLLSNDHAIILVDLERGNFKVSRDNQPSYESVKWPFENWRLAFEVNLKKVTHSEDSAFESWITRVEDSAIDQEPSGRANRNIEYILLDLEHAEFLNGIHSSENSESSLPDDQALSVVHYIREYYLPRLALSGIHIIRAISIRKTETSRTPASLFHVYSRETITRENCAYAPGDTEPVILIINMPVVELHSEDPVISPPGGSSYGNITVSRSAFLDHCILDPFSSINARTTLMPASFHLVNGRLDVQNITWVDSTGEQKCNWQEDFDDKTDIMEYKYWFTNKTDGVHYSITCSTYNRLQIPIVAGTSRSLVIEVSGETKLAVSFGDDGDRQQSSHATARWNATINIQSGPEGFKVGDIEPLVPNFESSVSTCGPTASNLAPNTTDALPDLGAVLRKRLSTTIDLSEVCNRLRAFGDTCRQKYLGLQTCFANPVFSRTGDAMFELWPKGQDTSRTLRHVSRNVTMSQSNNGTLNISREPQFPRSGKEESEDGSQLEDEDFRETQ